LHADRNVNPRDPESAQQIVAEYAALLERESQDGVYPGLARQLPYPKNTIKQAIETCALALAANQRMTGELRDFLEVAYVSLADYLDDDLARLMTEFHEASESFANDGRHVREKLDTSSWNVLTGSSRLAGDIALSVARDTEALRAEFKAFCS
jgi:hypothetical protein